MAKQTFTTGQVLTAAQMTSLQQTAMGGGEATAKTASYTLVALDAGSTVIMNSGSATTITVNTALFAAGDTVNIQNIGAGICTVLAGSATVNTAGSLALNQYEGGVLYFRSASTATFFDYVQTGSVSPLTTKGDLYGFSTLDARVPIGTNNQVLTADSAQALGLKWATPTATAESYSLISSAALTAAATVTITGISGKNSLLILLTGASSASASSGISLQFNTDTGGNYYGPSTSLQFNSTYAAADFSAFDNATDDRVRIANMSSAAASQVHAALTMRGANSAGVKTFIYNGGATPSTGNAQIMRIGQGYYDSASTISSVSAVSGTGNFDNGTMYVYGSA